MNPSKKPISRREFLAYAWLSSIGLLTLEGTALAFWYSVPRGGTIYVIADIPPFFPALFTDYGLWLNYTDQGLSAFSIQCPLRSHIFKWVDANHRFECPSCGSKFDPDGVYIEGPSPRHLDRYAMTIETNRETLKSNDEGQPIAVDLATIHKITINPDYIIRRNRPKSR